MARALSVRLLDDLTSEYKRSLRDKSTENASEVKKLEDNLDEIVNVEYVKEINKRLEDLGLTVISQSTNTYDPIQGKCILSFKVAGETYEKKVASLMKKIHEKRRKQCEILKAKDLELNEWRVKCIKAGEILDFDLPILPPIDNGIRCA